MTRLEFNETIKAFGINYPLSYTTGRYGTLESVYYWQNLAIHFNGSNYAVINGKIPLEVASIIYEKYPNNPYEIIIDDGYVDSTPYDFATDDKFESITEKYINAGITSEEFDQLCNKAYKNLLRRKNANKYIKSYHIDTKEGLIIFLTEMQDYLARKQGKKETYVKRYDEFMEIINYEMIKKVNPYISTYEWMQADEVNSTIFFQTLLKETETSFGREFRKAINEFDKVINPFINPGIEFDKMGNYLKKLKITADIPENEEDREGSCCEYYITEIGTQNTVGYERKVDGFYYSLYYEFERGHNLYIAHYFQNHEGNPDKGEYILIEYNGDNTPHRINLKYSLATGLIGEEYGPQSPASFKQVEFIYHELLRAIELASTITINNMKKETKYKKILTK